MTGPDGIPAKLAIDGGEKVRDRPLPPWPSFAEDEIAAAARVLASGKVNYWTGREVERFEERMAGLCGVEHAVALANGTLALELALRALGLGPGDEVVVTPRTFIASASAIVLCGATPVFADVDRVSQNIDAETVEPVLSDRTRAVVAVHHAGWPCDMDPLVALARDHGLAVVEDCAQALGARYRGRPVGSFGDVAAFSFCQDKIVTTAGEGGLLVTNDPGIRERAWSYKDHGKDREAAREGGDSATFRWVHESFGTNWRLTEIQAAVGLAQLAKLEAWLERRARNAGILMARLRELPAIRVPEPPASVRHAHYKFHAFVRLERLRPGWDTARVIEAIRAEGVPCSMGSCPEVYLEAAFEDSGLRPPSRLPVARELGETSVMTLVHPTLDDGDMEDIADAVEKVSSVAGHPDAAA